jgi:hypothetical protein
MTRMFSIAIAIAAATLAAAQSRAPERPLWKAAVAADKEHDLRRSFITPAGVTWMLTGVKGPGSFVGEDISTEILGIDASGEEIARVDLTELLAGRDITRYEDLAALPSGQVVLFASNDAGELYAYTIVPRENRVVSTLRLGGGRKTHHITDVVPAEDGRLLLIGRADARGWMMKLEPTLAIRWDKTLEDETMTVIHDAMVRPDGSIVAVGGQLLETGQTNLWIGTLTSEGQVIARKMTPGRDASIGVSDSGRIAVVHDLRTEHGWDVLVRAYAADLTEEWIATVVTGLHIAPESEIAAGPRGEWLVAAPKNDLLWIGAYSAAGTEMWSYPVPMENELWERLWNLGDLMVRGNEVTLPYTLLTLDEEKKQRQRIRVLKLPVRAQ